MNEVITKRDFDVPVALLYRAWSLPQHIKNWWGPEGFTNTFHEFDYREGGFWRFIMHGPDGKDYDNESRFIKIVPGEHLIIEHISLPKFIADVTFAEEGPHKSSLVWKMIFEEEKVYLSLKDFIAEKNEENLDRLAEELLKMK
jgi:uncharacterized protein YndB with AHSA1/START domain